MTMRQTPSSPFTYPDDAPQEDDNVKPPIFIVGTMRSGSTMLRLVLDSHPDIAMGEETGFMGALAATKAIPNWRYGRQWYGRLGWTDAELDARLREFYAGMFERYAMSQGKQRWGDKTPLHSWHMEEMARIFPDAVFVAIVRHPCAVVGSLKKRFHWDVSDAAEYWATTNAEVLRRAADLGDERFVLLRYEDLVAAPEGVLRELTSWLGEPWSPDVLRHNEVQAAKGAPRLVDGSTSTRQGISAQRTNRWRDELDAEERRRVAAVAADMAAFFGYALDDAADMAPLTAPGSARQMLLTSGDLGRRLAAHEPTLSLEPQAPVLAVPEMDVADLGRRLQQAESSLARIRARPVVRFSEAVRRCQRQLGLPRPQDVLSIVHGLRRRSTRLAARSTGQGSSENRRRAS